MSSRLSLLALLGAALLAGCAADDGRRPIAADSDAGSMDASIVSDAGDSDAGSDAGAMDASHADAGTYDGLGAACRRNGDCQSGLCLPLESGDNVCTRSCTEGTDPCLAGWSCGTLTGVEGTVCQCAPSTELCDGLDNDCNGIVDDADVTNPECTRSVGDGSICSAGTCITPPCRSDGDCRLGEACTPQGLCVANVPAIRVCLVDPGTGATMIETCFPGALAPPTVSFGAVWLGDSTTRLVRVFNDGYRGLELGGVELDGDVINPSLSGSPVQATVAAGAHLDLNLSFRAVSDATLESTLVIPSNDTQLPTVLVPVKASINICGEGATGPQPTASVVVRNGTTVIDPTMESVMPGTSLTLDGSSSTAQEPDHITSYGWRLVSQPSGGSAVLTGTSPTITLRPTLEGDYVVELIVSTSGQCMSDPVTISLHATNDSRVRIEVTWPQAYGDVDLHYIGPGGSMYQNSPNVTDIDWNYSLATAYGTGTPSPTGATIRDFWGLNNTCSPNGTTTDDATLDLDQRSGYGPEVITHRHPFEGTYKVAVHYYCNGSGTTVSPHVKVLVDGNVAWEGTMPGMTTRQVWDAAQIVVSDGGATIQVVPLTTPLYRISQGC